MMPAPRARPRIGGKIPTWKDILGLAGGSYYGTDVKISERRPLHLPFQAPSRTAVDDFFRIGLENGGKNNGSPAACGDGAYGAYLLDADGYNIEAIYRELQCV